MASASRGATSFPVVPMFHANAWGVPYTAAMLGVQAGVPGPHLHPDDIIPLFESEQVTLAAACPPSGCRWCRSWRDWGKWKLHPDAHDRRRLRRARGDDPRVRPARHPGLQGWGMTETSPWRVSAHRACRSAWARKSSSRRGEAGLRCRSSDIRAMGDRGEQPWDGKRGRDPGARALGRGQLLRPGGARELRTTDGWFRTGDVAPSIAGFIKITDRTKDLIKSGGEWISSVDLENAIMGHPAVQEAAVVAVPHPKWAERPLAVVVLKDGAQRDAEETQALSGAEVRQVDGPGRLRVRRCDPADLDRQVPEDRVARAVSGLEVGQRRAESRLRNLAGAKGVVRQKSTHLRADAFSCKRLAGVCGRHRHVGRQRGDAGPPRHEHRTEHRCRNCSATPVAAKGYSF